MYGVINYIMFEQKMAVFTERLNFNKMRKYISTTYNSSSTFLRLFAHFFFFPSLFFLFLSVLQSCLPYHPHSVEIYMQIDNFTVVLTLKYYFSTDLCSFYFLVTFDIILQPHDSRVWQTSKLFKELRVWQKRGFEEAGKTVLR